jgi:intein/homing endonuclease
MSVQTKIITDETKIRDSLYIHDQKEYPYIVNRVSDISLTKFVELVFRNKFGDPLRLLPFQSVMLQMMWAKKFPMVLACRGAGKTYMLAVYCILKCLLVPGTKVVIVSGGFRQAKFTFQYIDEIIKSSPIIEETIRKFHPGNSFGVKFATDKVYLKVGHNTEITGIPVGDGSKVRGMRACVEPTTIVETNNGLRRIKDIVDNPEDITLHYGNGKFAAPSKFVKTCPIDAYKITTECGYEVVCSDIHRLWTTKGWKDAVKLQPSKDFLPLELGGKFNSEEKLGVDLAWLLGAVISEGCCSNKYRISVKNAVGEFCDRVEQIAIDKFGKASRYYCPPREDPRGWTSKPSYEIHFGNLKQRQWLESEIGLGYSTARFKKIPAAILNGSRDEVISFLTGLFDGDGTAYLYKDKTRENNLGISYYTASEQLGKDVQVLLLKLGIMCSRTSRSSKLSDHPQYMLRINGVQMMKFINTIRPSRFVEVYKKADLDIRFCKEKTEKVIRSVEKLDGKHILYDFEIPESHSFIGNGIKNHNTTLVCDEVASIDDQVFDTAIGPFLSVKADPSEAVIVQEFIARLRKLGANEEIIGKIEEERRGGGNQLVLSGTATYQFSHFFRRYEAYNIFAKSNGNPQVIKEGLRRQSRDGTISVTDEMLERWKKIWHEYAVFSLPYHAMPEGFLDSDIVANHKAIMDPVIFGHEYECKFSKDTNGFFPRSIIDAASPGKGNPEEFHYELFGEPGFQYVMGLDPARWNDNFGLVILKLVGTTAQVVYCDSWNKSKWEVSIDRIKDALARFPNITYIACDKGGGGDTVQEMLASAKYLREGEQPIIEIEPSDDYKAIPNARRILEMVNFHTWAVPANHNLKRDFIMKNVIFPGRLDDDIVMEKHAKRLLDVPEFDYEDNEHIACVEHINNLLYGTENDDGDPITLGAYKEMQELTNELCTIVQTVTEKGTEGFGLQKLSDQPDGLDVRRRDRYSALLLAAHAARVIKGHGHEKSWGKAYGGTPQDILKNAPRRGMGYTPMNRKGGVIY